MSEVPTQPYPRHRVVSKTFGRRFLRALGRLTHIGAGLGLCLAGFGVGYWLVASESEVAPPVATPLEPAVTWSRVPTTPVELSIRATGTVMAAAPALFPSPLTGTVAQVHPSLAAGGRVMAGSDLVIFDTTDLDVAVAAAERAVATAEEELARAEAIAARAQSDVAADPSLLANAGPLRLGQPQLERANAAVAAALADVTLARRYRDQARMVAPVDGWTLGEGVAPGSRVAQGQSLAAWIPATDGAVVIEAAVTPNQARWLAGRPHEAWKARITVPNGEVAGRVLGLREQVDPMSGARLVRIAVAEVWDPSLLPLGAEASVDLTAASDPGLRLIPDDWFTPSGDLWLVDTDQRLIATTPEPMGRLPGGVVIDATALPQDAVVVPGALVTGRSGMRVRLVPEPGAMGGLQSPEADQASSGDDEPLFWIREGE